MSDGLTYLLGYPLSRSCIRDPFEFDFTVKLPCASYLRWKVTKVGRTIAGYLASIGQNGISPLLQRQQT